MVTVDDPCAYPFHDCRMGQLVETRGDVSLEGPVIVPGPESMNLSDRVLSATSGAETVADRLEIRLEDRLQHQQQRRLDRAIHRSGDAESPELAAPRLGDESLPHRQRSKRPRLQLVSNLAQERHDLDISCDRCRCQPVNPG